MQSPLWTIRTYVDAAGVDVIDHWYNAQVEKLQAKFDTRMKFLASQPIDQWKLEPARRLHRECTGLWEVRWEFKNVQYRPLGAFTAHREFTLLFVATEKGGKLEPKNACKISLERLEEILSHRRMTNVRTFE